MDKPEGFEVTDYGDKHEKYDQLSVIKQIIDERVRESPAHAVIVKFAGNQMTLAYHCYEMHLPARMKQVQELANDVFRESLSHLKKEFKRRTKQVLTLKELKDLANYTVQKVSLNERYYMNSWRVFEMGLE